MKQMGRCGWANKKDVLSLWIMAILLERDCYGYELLQAINSNPFLGPINPGGLYRILRELEFEGLVTSNWQVGCGPARRTYRLTDKGKEMLKNWKGLFEKHKVFIEQVLEKLEKGGV